MKIAFAYWDERIAPVFDTARYLRVVEIASGRRIGQMDETLPDGLHVEKALRLVQLGLDTLVCGAISRPLHEAVSAYGIQVFSFVAGDLDTVIRAWMSGNLMHGGFTMPGCGRRRGCRFRAANDTGDGSRKSFRQGQGGPKIESRQGGRQRRHGQKNGRRAS